MQKSLQKILTQFPVADYSFVLYNLRIYLAYLSRQEIYLNKNKLNLHISHLRKINLRMFPPEKAKDLLGKELFPRLKLFFLLSLLLGFIEITENNLLKINKEKIEGFFSFSLVEQYILLVITFWEKIPWTCLQNKEKDWQERHKYLSLLATLPIGEQSNLAENLLLNKIMKDLSSQCDPLANLILPSFRNFAFLQYTLIPSKLCLQTITVSKLGGEIIACLLQQLTERLDYRLSKAWQALEKGDKQKAGQMAKSLLTDFSNYPDVYNLLGALYFTEENYEQALFYYRKARGKCQQWLGYNFRESFSLQPEEKRKIFLKAQMGLASAYAGQNNWVMVKEIILDILNLDPTDSLGAKFLLKKTEKNLANKKTPL